MYDETELQSYKDDARREPSNLEKEIAKVTTALVAEHGRKAVVDEFSRITGLGPRVFDCYRNGTRLPDKFMLFYLGLVDEGVLGEWAGKCLEIREKYGEGLPHTVQPVGDK